MEYEVGSEQAQEALGARVAHACAGEPCVIYLKGDLGTGKTTFARGFLRGLGYHGSVKSPTYTLLEPYPIGPLHCFHLDLYRLADPEELEYLGLRDLLDASAVFLVEWPERGYGGLPPPDLEVHLRYARRGRHVDFAACSARGGEVMQRLATG